MSAPKGKYIYGVHIPYEFEPYHTLCTYATHIITCSYVHVWRTTRKVYNIRTCMARSLTRAHLFGSMEEDEECDYDHLFYYNSNARGGDMGKL